MSDHPELPADIVIEPVWLVEATYAPDAAETRAPFRAEHVIGVEARKAAGVIIEAGAFADVSATIMIVRAADEAEAIAIVSDDVYLRNGVWVELRARRFGRVTREARARS
ncbi:MAG: YciI family protein [Candidatus Limnocylindrales bacterium]